MNQNEQISEEQSIDSSQQGIESNRSDVQNSDKINIEEEKRQDAEEYKVNLSISANQSEFVDSNHSKLKPRRKEGTDNIIKLPTLYKATTLKTSEVMKYLSRMP